MTRDDGTFELGNVGQGTYYVRVSFVGYVPQLISDVTITREEQQVDVGTVTLEQDAALLDEVQVSAEREYMEVGIDRTIYNTRGRYGGSASTNYGSGPWNAYANYSLRYSEWDREGWRFRENRYLDPITFLRQDMTGEQGGLSHNINTNNEQITEEGVTILTFENFDTEQSYGAELIGSLTFGDWLKSNASLNVYKRVTEAGSLSSELSNNALGFRTRLFATAEVGPGLKLQLSQSYRSPMSIPGGRIAAWLQTDVALQQEVLSGRGSLNLRVRDLFGAPNELIERDMERYYQEYYQERNSRGVQLSFRYTFSQGGSDRGGDNDGGRRRGRRGR